MQMVSISGRRMRCAVAAALGAFSIAGAARAAVVINEFQYDDTGAADDREFVELYNNGLTPIDISGWTLGGRDNATSPLNTIVTIPGALGSSTTVIPAGGYYVIGNTAVQNVNQVAAGGFLENDAETIELRQGVFASATLADAVVYEANKGPGTAPNTPGTAYGTLPADVAADVNVGGNANSPGYWANSQGDDLSTNTTTVAVARFVDGSDTNNNGRDFGLRPATPGASNLAGGAVTTLYTPANVDAAAVSSDVPGLRGSFFNNSAAPLGAGAKVINPTVVSQYNLTAIPASPQGGNAITVVDNSGGGEVAVGFDVHQGQGAFNIDAYLDTTDHPAGAGNHETTIYGTMGSIGSLFNTPDLEGDIFADVAPGNASDASGVAWVYQKFQSRAILYLVDAGDGGNSSPDVPGVAQEWTILQEIDLSNAASAWHQLAIQVNPDGTGFGVLDGTIYPFTTAANLAGEFYVGYRENIGGSPGAPGAGFTFRPPTFDISTSAIPEPATISLLGLAGVGLLGRRRNRRA